MPGRPGRNSTDAFEACQARPQPIPECLCHRHRGERRGHRTSEKTIIFAPPSLRKRSHFSAPGRLGRQRGWFGVCLVDGCVLLSDVLLNDTSRLISYTLMHHVPQNGGNRRIQRGALHSFTAAPNNKVSFSVKHRYKASHHH